MISSRRVKTAKEVATLLLGLPWELLHDGDGYLFQGAKPTRVRRRLPTGGARLLGCLRAGKLRIVKVLADHPHSGLGRFRNLCN